MSLAVVSLTACSGELAGSEDGSSTPDLADPGDRSIGSVTMVEGVPVTRIGDGRGLAAARAGDELVVATTTDTYRVIGGQDPVAIGSAVDDVRELAVDLDGTMLAVWGSDGSMELWSLAGEAELVRSTPGRADPAFELGGALSVALAPHRRATIVTPSAIEIVSMADGSVEIVDPPDGRRFGPAALAADGTIVAASLVGGPRAEVLLPRAGSEPEVRELDVHEDQTVVRAASDPDGTLAAFGVAAPSDTSTGTVAVEDLRDAGRSWSVEIPTRPDSESWTLGSDGTVAAVDDSTVRGIGAHGVESWSVRTGEDNPAVWIRPEGERSFLVVLADGSASRLEIGGAVQPVLAGTGRAVRSVTSTPNLGHLSTVDAAGTVTTWAADGGGVQRLDRFVAGEVTDVEVAADGRFAASTSLGDVLGGSLGLDGDPPGAQLALAHPEGNVDSVAFSPSGELLVTGVSERRGSIAFDDTIAVWSGDQRTQQLRGELEDVAGCSFFRHDLEFVAGDLVASTSHDFTVSLVDPVAGEVVHTFPAHGNSVLDVAATESGSRFVSSSDDSTMRLWDVGTRELVEEYAVDMGGFWSMAFVDENVLVVSDLTGGISHFDLRTGDRTTMFEAGKDRESELVLSSDGRLAAAGAEGGLIRLWSVASGELVAELQGHRDSVSTVAFTDDGRRLLSGSRDGTVIVWDLIVA